ncbi:hypothetical protein [Sorangium sp. So ce1078]|uniref:hypothetical protein n=1 Tax=Sorangium sp. So ce1078 TaxID=3133329 RepID=UPI003F61B183
MSIYETWGFSDTPFATTALQPNELGSKLLVGRDAEVRQLDLRLNNPPAIPTVEGANGVGKTSLVNVTTYRSYTRHRTEGSGALFVPCRRPFQLSPDSGINTFANEVFVEVGQTLIELQRSILASNSATTEQLLRLVTSPIAGSVERGLIGLGRIRGTGTTPAPPDPEMFAQQMLAWLKEIFPAHKDGGVVCIIDNVELLQTSQSARRVIEQLRDPILMSVGIRWILCGAAGIVRSAVSSPRLEGLLHDPIEVGGMEERHASGILPSRVSAYAVRDDAYLPILVDDFERLYNILRGNLRATLGYADRYCMAIAESSSPSTPEDKRNRFSEWLSNETALAYNAVVEEMPPRTRETFQTAINIGGEFSPGDYEHFGFTSSQALRPHVKTLEDLGLVVSQQDDVDKRRRTVSVLPKGWLVAYALEEQGQKNS